MGPIKDLGTGMYSVYEDVEGDQVFILPQNDAGSAVLFVGQFQGHACAVVLPGSETELRRLFDRIIAVVHGETATLDELGCVGDDR